MLTRREDPFLVARRKCLEKDTLTPFIDRNALNEGEDGQIRYFTGKVIRKEYLDSFVRTPVGTKAKEPPDTHFHKEVTRLEDAIKTRRNNLRAKMEELSSEYRTRRGANEDIDQKAFKPLDRLPLEAATQAVFNMITRPETLKEVLAGYSDEVHFEPDQNLVDPPSPVQEEEDQDVESGKEFELPSDLPLSWADIESVEPAYVRQPLLSGSSFNQNEEKQPKATVRLKPARKPKEVNVTSLQKDRERKRSEDDPTKVVVASDGAIPKGDRPPDGDGVQTN